MKRLHAIATACIVALLSAGPAPAADISTLEAALTHALTHNRDVQRARLAVDQREALWVELRGHILPTVGVDAHYLRRDERLLSNFNGTTFGSPDAWDARVYVRQVLYGGGAAAGTAQREHALTDVDLAGLDTVVNQVVYDVQQSFLTAVWAEAEAAVREEGVQLLQNQLNNVRAKRDVGASSDFEVLRAEVELANARVAALRAGNDARLRREELHVLLGTGATLGKLQAPAPTPVTPGTLDEVRAAARERRPELRAAERNIAAARAGRTLARAGYLPIVDLEAQYGVEKDTFSNGFWDSRHGWQIGIGGDWILFDSLSTSGKVRQARLSVALADVEMQHATFTVGLDVERAYAGYAEAQELEQATRQIERTAAESLRLAEVRYEAGTATQLDVFAARVALTEARSNALRARYDLQASLVDLRRAMGDFSLTATGSH